MTTITTASQAATSVVVVSEKGGQGLPGADGADGSGFNQVRKSKLDNPLCHLFKTNKLVEASAPTGTDADVTWTRSTTGTYVDRYGTVKTAAINTPREEKEGFLIEGASTNLALYSEDFSNAAWYFPSGDGSVLINQFTSPDGALTGDKITLNDSNVLLRQGISVTAGDTYTLSFWFLTSTADITTINIDIGDGAKSPISGSITSGSYTRLSHTVIAGVNNYLDIEFRSLSGGDVSIWGAQLEQLPFASSYIPTTSASVTRTADVVSVDPVNNIFNSSGEWSVSIDHSLLGLLGANTLQTLLGSAQINAAAWNGYVSGTSCKISGTSNQLIDSLVEDGLFTVSGGINSQQQYKNGVATVSGTLPSIDTVITVLKLGIDENGNNHLYGHLKDFRLYDFALNADEVEYLS